MLAKFQSSEQICTDIKTNDYVYYTAKHIKNGKMVGYCACKPEGNYLLLSKIYVHKDYRVNGISRCFLKEVIDICRRGYSFDKIRLTVNKHNNTSIAAYNKIGFATVDSVKTDIGSGFYMDDFVMELRV
jgi:ribosomal protein S18 acetylase RimI-like enzyme